MTIRPFWLLAVLLALVAWAVFAAPPTPSGTSGYYVVPSCGSETMNAGQINAPRMDPSGQICTGGGAGGAASGIPNQITVSCGTGSTTLLAAGAATRFVFVKVPSTATGPVWVNWTGVAAVVTPPSQDIGPGVSMTWSPTTGFLPTSAINCIAGAASQVTVIYK
jgi:hypothetical protein